MFKSLKVGRLGLWILATGSAVLLASCGSDDGLGRRHPVKGTVTYNGTPLEQGVISFVPEDPAGVGASGKVEKGYYTLSTGGDGDGARAGKYKVTITAKEPSLDKAKAEFEKTSGRTEAGFIPQQFITKAAAQAKNLIPGGYGDVRSTNLAAEVKDQSNTIDFALTDAEAPAEPKPVGKGKR
jgi:hypothetical protein